MAEDKGSDLDVFEGLAKKRGADGQAGADGRGVPTPQPTLRGGLGTGGPVALPKPSPPPPRPGGAPVSVGPSSLPKPKPPPPKKSPSSAPPPPMFERQPISEPPAISVREVDEVPGAADSILPGEASADLDWDDHEEATQVFDKSDADLFGDLSPRARLPEDADSTARRDVSGAVRLLATSGRAAAPAAQPRLAPAPDPYLPRIPAPAPVPRELAEPAAYTPTPPADARPPHPSWVPSMPPPAPQPAGKTNWILAVVALLAVLTGAFFYWRSVAAQGTVTIEVTHQGKPVDRANIYIDGQKKCEFSPCKLELTPGSKQLRVVAGALAGSQTVDVGGGKELRVEIVLGVSTETAPAAEPDAAPDAPATLKLDSALRGVRVFVDGVDKGKLPLELTGIKPGKVTLRFEAEGGSHGKLEKVVELAPGQTLALGDVKLPLAKVKTIFELETRGATVKLAGGPGAGAPASEQTLVFQESRATVVLDTARTWRVTATLAGYRTFEHTLGFVETAAEMTVTIKLEREEKVADAAPTPAPVPAPAPGKPPVTDKPEPKPAPPPAASAAAASGQGILNANSIPPSKVTIDGKPYGDTPVTGIKVSAGSHTVVFKHPKLGTKSRTITVGAGQTKTAAVRFKEKEEE
jgi:serine/threonine-protein kinase